MHGSSKWFGVTLGAEGRPIGVEFCPPLPIFLSISLSFSLFLSRCCSLIVNMFFNSQLRSLVVQTWVDYSSKFIHLPQLRPSKSILQQ